MLRQKIQKRLPCSCGLCTCIPLISTNVCQTSEDLIFLSVPSLLRCVVPFASFCLLRNFRIFISLMVCCHCCPSLKTTLSSPKSCCITASCLANSGVVSARRGNSWSLLCDQKCQAWKPELVPITGASSHHCPSRAAYVCGLRSHEPKPASGRHAMGHCTKGMQTSASSNLYCCTCIQVWMSFHDATCVFFREDRRSQEHQCQQSYNLRNRDALRCNGDLSLSTVSWCHHLKLPCPRYICSAYSSKYVSFLLHVHLKCGNQIRITCRLSSVQLAVPCPGLIPPNLERCLPSPQTKNMSMMPSSHLAFLHKIQKITKESPSLVNYQSCMQSIILRDLSQTNQNSDLSLDHMSCLIAASEADLPTQRDPASNC